MTFKGLKIDMRCLAKYDAQVLDTTLFTWILELLLLWRSNSRLGVANSRMPSSSFMPARSAGFVCCGAAQ